MVAIWWWRRPSSAGPRRLLVALLVIFYAASTPAGAGLLAFGLVHGLQPLDARDASGVDAVVVLGGGVETVSAAHVVLGQLTTILGAHGVSIAQVVQEVGAPTWVVVLTHEAREGSLKDALAEISAFEETRKPPHAYPVVSSRGVSELGWA